MNETDRKQIETTEKVAKLLLAIIVFTRPSTLSAEVRAEQAFRDADAFLRVADTKGCSPSEILRGFVESEAAGSL